MGKRFMQTEMRGIVVHPASSNTTENQQTVDDAFRSILEGLRTTLPGVQVLFAFLLTLPLQQSFGTLNGPERTAYLIALFGSAAASILLIAPSAHQRLRAPKSGVVRKSQRHLRATVYLTIAGTLAFALALAAAVYLVTAIVLESIPAAVGAGVVALLTAWAWFYIPLVTFERVE